MTVNDDKRLKDAGYMAWAGDPSGRTLVHPSGHRLLSKEQALAELEGGESD